MDDGHGCRNGSGFGLPHCATAHAAQVQADEFLASMYDMGIGETFLITVQIKLDFLKGLHHFMSRDPPF